MNESLIGEEVSLDAPADDTLVPLLVGAVEAFLVAAGGAPRDLGRLERDLQRAFSDLEHQAADKRVFARLVMAADGIEVHLQPSRGSEIDLTVICPT